MWNDLNYESDEDDGDGVEECLIAGVGDRQLERESGREPAPLGGMKRRAAEVAGAEDPSNARASVRIRMRGVGRDNGGACRERGDGPVYHLRPARRRSPVLEPTRCGRRE